MMYSEIIVHDGVFHADDVVAVCLVKFFYNCHVKVTRTRDEDYINSKRECDDVLIVDVGGGEFDHHQASCKRHPDGTKYCGATLLFEHITGSMETPWSGTLFYDRILRPIELGDNGVKYDDPYDYVLGKYISSFLPEWYEESSLDDLFYTVVSSVLPWVLKLLEADSVELMDSIIEELGELYIPRDLKHCKAILSGMKEVQKLYLNSMNKEVVYLINPKLPWRNVLICSDAKLVIFIASNGDIMLQTVPVEPDSFTNKIDIPLDIFDDWKGAHFVHQNKFLGGITPGDNEEDALSYITEKALDIVERNGGKCNE